MENNFQMLMILHSEEDLYNFFFRNMLIKLDLEFEKLAPSKPTITHLDVLKEVNMFAWIVYQRSDCPVEMIVWYFCDCSCKWKMYHCVNLEHNHTFKYKKVMISPIYKNINNCSKRIS